MVLPPNRIGASRGPNGSTLDDVVAAINSLTAVVGEQIVVLNSQRAFLEDIAVGLDKLIGSDTLEFGTWPGLIRWLDRFIAYSDNFDEFPPTMSTSLRNLSSTAQAFFRYAGGNNYGAATRPYGIMEALGEPIDAVGNDVEGFLYQLVNSIGVRGTSPTNLSALAYLALIADSTERSADCCEENSQPGGGGENPPPGPSFSCGLESTPYRATSYEFRRNLPADQLDEYIVMFTGFSSQSPSGFSETISNDTVPLPCYEGPANAQLCWEWNLSSGQVPGQLLVYESSPGGLFSPVIGTNVGVTQGEGSTATLTLAGAGEKYMLCVRVAENSGVPQHLNYWIDRNGPPA